MKKIIAFIVIVLVASAVYWQQNVYLSSDYLARVNGTLFPVRAVDVFVAYTKLQKPDITRKQVLNGLIENHILAEYANQKSSATNHDLHDEHGVNRVGYSEQTRFENQLFKLIRVVFSKNLKQSMDESGIQDPLEMLVAPLNLDDEGLSPILEIQNRLHHEMTPEQEKMAKQWVLGRYRFPDGQEEDISLWDIYRRLNIQLKVQLHEKNYAYLKQAVRQYMATRYSIHWFENYSVLNEEEVNAVKRMVHQKMDKQEFLHESGLAHDIHDDNPVVKKLAESVSQEEIQQYYEQHKEDFRRVEKVRARHIRLASQQQADDVYAQLQGNTLSFGEAIARFSSAPDKDAEVPGSLGWIDRETRSSNWLRGVAFVQAEKRISRPFRSPQLPGQQVYWEIVYLDEKVMGYQEPDSEGVRYVASREIARQKAQQQFVDTRNRLKEETSIQVNTRLL